MQKLLSTTALVVALGFPAITLAQSSDTTASSETLGQSPKMSGFLSARGQSDLHASDLMGHDVHARRSGNELTETGDQASGSPDKSRNMASMARDDLDDMDKIGQINEIVLSGDGQVRALVISVGGFLGMGDHDVAVTMDKVTFATDADDQSQMYIVVSTAGDMIENAPAYDRTEARNAAASGNDGMRNDTREAFAAPQMERDGYNQVDAQEVSTDILIGKTVYDASDNDVGDVTELVIDEDGKITDVVIDFGGFLGIGSSQASLDFKELTILTNEGYEDVRLYVDATKEQIQNLPRYMASK